MSEENIEQKGFVEESIMTLSNPQAYFEIMPTSGGFGQPIVKVLLYGLIAGLFTFIWNFLGYMPMGGLMNLFGSGIGVMVFFWSIIGTLIGLFIGGLILLILSAIGQGNTDYEANVRVAASLTVLTPITAAFGFLFGFSYMLATIVNTIINLYGVWLLYHALGASLKAKPGSAKVISLIIAVIYLIFFLVGLGSARLVEQYSHMAENPSNEEIMDMAENLAKEMGGEDAEEAVDQMMTGKDGYYLEMANGNEIESPSSTQLLMALETLNAENDFCILSKGEEFIQAAYSEDGFTLQYKDASGHFEASELQGQGAVMMIFTTYLEARDDWKDAVEWQIVE